MDDLFTISTAPVHPTRNDAVFDGAKAQSESRSTGYHHNIPRQGKKKSFLSRFFIQILFFYFRDESLLAMFMHQVNTSLTKSIFLRMLQYAS
jgi:hypothetical protein